MQKLNDKIHGLIEAFSNSQYSLLKETYLQGVNSNDIAAIEIIVQATKHELHRKDLSSKLQFEIIKECVDSWNPFLVNRIKQEIVPIFSHILLNFLKESKEEKQQLSEDEIKVESLVAESLFIWSKWFTSDNILSDTIYNLSSVGQLFPQHFLYFNQLGKIVSSSLATRNVCFIDDQLYQIEYEKGIQTNKVIGFPDSIQVQSREDYKDHHNKQQKIKISWDDSAVKPFPYRLLCKRTGENRGYAIYFDDKETAIKIQDYIHYIKAKTAILRISQLFKSIVSQFKAKVANEYVHSKIMQFNKNNTNNNDNESKNQQNDIRKMYFNHPSKQSSSKSDNSSSKPSKDEGSQTEDGSSGTPK